VNFNWQVIVSIQVIISPQWANTLQRQSKGSGDSGTGMEGCTAMDPASAGHWTSLLPRHWLVGGNGEPKPPSRARIYVSRPL